MALAKIPLRTIGGTQAEFSKLAVFVETDQAGRTFYKLEGQDNDKRAAIGFHFEKQEGIEHIIDTIQEFLQQQERKLLQEAGKQNG